MTSYASMYVCISVREAHVWIKKDERKKMIDRAKMFDGCRMFKLSSHWSRISEKFAGTRKRKLNEKFRESHERLADN